MPNELLLEGLDGSNPLGFLAALGVLRVLTEQSAPPETPRLAWRNEGLWRPVIDTDRSREELVALLVDDIGTWSSDPALDLTYSKQDGATKLANDLKPLPRRYREFLEGLLAASDARYHRALAYAAAFATEIATDNNGNVKPTALHFTAGQQEFLAMVTQLVEGAKGVTGVGAKDLEEALWGPWRYERPLPVLGWDSTASRDYALRASDPSKDKKSGIPGAEWLAFRGLAFVPVAPRGRRIITTGCGGGWKDGYFQWPLWEVPVDAEVARSLLGRGEMESLSQPERSALGIGIVFRSSIRRSDQGGYGSFTPAQVV